MKDQLEESRISKELTRADDGTDPFSSAVRATRMPMVISDPNQPDNPIVFTNDAFSLLTGFAREEVLGRNCRFLQGPETDPRDVDRIRMGLAERRPAEVELLNYRRDGSTFWNRLLVSPVFDNDGNLAYFFASLVDITRERESVAQLQSARDDLEAEVLQRKSDLVETENKLRFALMAAGLGSWSLNLATYDMVVTDGSKLNFGRSVTLPFTYEDVKAAVHPDDRQKRDAALAEALDETNDYNVEYRIITPTGEQRWLHVRGQVFRRADGTPLSLLGVSQDITERKQLEAHRTLMANELGHRVKNTLAILQVIVSQTLRNSESLEQASETLSSRIHSMAMANDILVKERWESAPMTELVGHTLATFGADQQRINVDGPEVHLPGQIVVALTLALHELATNAIKYGALSNLNGKVFLSWKIHEAQDSPELHISWKEVDGPKVSPPERTGFGSKLIQRVLASELGGSALVSYGVAGVTFEAVAPLPRQGANNGE